VQGIGLLGYLDVWSFSASHVAKSPWITGNREDVIGLDICYDEVFDCVEAWCEVLEIGVCAVEFEFRDDEERETEVHGYVLRLRKARAGIAEAFAEGCCGLVKVSQTRAERDAVYIADFGVWREDCGKLVQDRRRRRRRVRRVRLGAGCPTSVGGWE